MLHSGDPGAHVDKDSDHVESVLQAGLAVARDPDQRRPGELTLLPMVNRGHGIPIFVPVTCLDLDEGNRVPALDDKVDVAMARSETTVHDRPAADPAPPLGHPLAAGPEL